MIKKWCVGTQKSNTFVIFPLFAGKKDILTRVNYSISKILVFWTFLTASSAQKFLKEALLLAWNQVKKMLQIEQKLCKL